jgi:hypothetical protein
VGLHADLTSSAKEEYVPNDNVAKLIKPGAFEDRSQRFSAMAPALCWRRSSRPKWPISLPSTPA